jgi:hypothetical protein
MRFDEEDFNLMSARQSSAGKALESNVLRRRRGQQTPVVMNKLWRSSR